MPHHNAFGQPIGQPLGEWEPPRFPDHAPLIGATVRLDPLDVPRHAGPLFDAYQSVSDELWTYMSIGPFATVEELTSTLTKLSRLDGWLLYSAVLDGVVVGFMAYLRITPIDGTIEIGSIVYSPALQRTTGATEAVYLMLKNVFDLGYRRCEWKCDALNEASRLAALRLGFQFEGVFRQATHYKGRNRDTAWYAIIDNEWPRIEAGFAVWMSEGNFDVHGKQRRSLVEVRNSLP